MGVFFGEVTLETVKGRASYHDISDEIRENIKKSELKNGCVVISSAHTTCSLYFDECMHDTNYWGDEYLQAESKSIFSTLYGNSMKNFVTALYDGKTVSKKEIQELKDFLEELE